MKILHGDCLTLLIQTTSDSVDLVYLDPPFFTNRSHSATTRDRTQTFSFTDSWRNLTEYAEFMRLRLLEIHRVLKPTGSVFLHCDKSANFLALNNFVQKLFGFINAGQIPLKDYYPLIKPFFSTQKPSILSSIRNLERILKPPM
jgi:site-specific DNA-methyltransferase (adenine-specific)